MSEIKLTRIGRYKIAWDRSDAVGKNIKSAEEYDTEKLRRLAELGKRLKQDMKSKKLSPLLTKVHHYWVSWVPNGAATCRRYLPA